MFALLIPGRPLQSPTIISETQYAFNIPSSPPFNHLALFLLPDANLPIDAGATVWIQVPDSSDFRFLGALAAGKPSAIYKIRHPNSATSNIGVDQEGDVMLDDTSHPSLENHASQQSSRPIVIGVQISPAAEVQAQLDQHKPQSTSTALVKSGGSATGSGKVETKVLAQRIIGNAFNFLSSFGTEMIPLKAFQEWWKKFEKKIELDPTFLERET